MNRMEQLLNKIERRLGTRLLNLPKEIAKDTIVVVKDIVANSRAYGNPCKVVS